MISSHGWLRVAEVAPIYGSESQVDDDGNVCVIKKSFEEFLSLVGEFLDVLNCFLHGFYSVDFI